MATDFFTTAVWVRGTLVLSAIYSITHGAQRTMQATHLLVLLMVRWIRSISPWPSAWRARLARIIDAATVPGWSGFMPSLAAFLPDKHRDARATGQPQWCACLAIPVQYGMDPGEGDPCSADAWTMITVRPHEHVPSERLMSDYAVALPVPEEIYDRARQVAAGTAQSVEAVLLQQLQAAFMAPLPPLPPDEQRELEALTSSRMRRYGRWRVNRWPRTSRRVCTCSWMRTLRGRWRRPSGLNWRRW